MNILYITHYFFPEMGAPAARAYELARHWQQRGHRVTVVTGVPNHPTGVLYEGYKNRLLQREIIDGMEVIRAYVFLTPNKGLFLRTLNYVSFMVTSLLAAMRLRAVRFDVVLATSPQLLNGVSGYLVSRIKGLPFVFDVRDLWPQSIVAVGALRDNWIVRVLERLERFLYSSARHIVATVEGIRCDLIQRGVPARKVTVVPNGVDLEMFRRLGKDGEIRQEYGLEGCFVVSYIGTHGMAHGLELVLLAAERLKDEGIVFLFIGEGAEKEQLKRRKEEIGLDKVRFIGRQPRQRIPLFIAASDVCLVCLSANEFFDYAVPSKLYEYMACERPVILSAKGASQRLVESSGGGIAVEPEHPEALSEAILRIYRDASLGERLGVQGRHFVEKYMDRRRFSIRYEQILARAAKSCG